MTANPLLSQCRRQPVNLVLSRHQGLDKIRVQLQTFLGQESLEYASVLLRRQSLATRMALKIKIGLRLQDTPCSLPVRVSNCKKEKYSSLLKEMFLCVSSTYSWPRKRSAQKREGTHRSEYSQSLVSR